MGIKLSDGEGLSQTCRGKKQLTVLREAAHKGGTHREPKPHLAALPSAAYWSQLPGNKKSLRQDFVLRSNYCTLTTPA